MRRARQLAVRVPASILRPCQQLVLRTAVRATAVAHHSVATAPWTAVAVPQRFSQVAGLHTSAARAGGDDNVVNVPSMGDSIVDGTLSVVEVPVGSYVNEDDVVAVLETDKVSFEVRSPSSGVVGEYFANEGDTVAVGQPLFRLTAGEAPAAGGAKGGAAKADASASGGEAAGSAEAKEMVVDVPNLGDSIVDGTLSDIAVQPGGDVAVDDVVAVIDTDKVSFEVRAPASGKVLEFFATEGDTIRVGERLFSLSATGGAPASTPAPSASSDTAAASAPAATSGSDGGHGGRQPLIRFRHGKRDAAPAAPSASKAASSSPPKPAVTTTTGSGSLEVTVEHKTFMDLPPMFGRPPLGDLESDMIESGGAAGF